MFRFSLVLARLRGTPQHGARRCSQHRALQQEDRRGTLGYQLWTPRHRWVAARVVRGLCAQRIIQHISHASFIQSIFQIRICTFFHQGGGFFVCVWHRFCFLHTSSNTERQRPTANIRKNCFISTALVMRQGRDPATPFLRQHPCCTSAPGGTGNGPISPFY